MTKHSARLERIRRELDKRAPALPILILSYGLDGDSSYHGRGEDVYTEDEVKELATSHQLIVMRYGHWPPGIEADRTIQMTWGDEGEEVARDVAPGRA